MGIGKSLNDVFIEDAEQRLDLNGLTIDCIRLAADRKGWRNVSRRRCIIRSDDTDDAD